MSELVGRKLGRYEIVAFVGRGGMGEVLRARDTELGRDVAIKVLPAETAKNEARVERFKREARAVAQLSHPNILDIHDFGTEAGVLYSVTELLEGSDLQHRLEDRAFPISAVLKVGRAVAEGLAAAHSKGIIHRDIKPANIFVTKTGQVKILDFGIAGLKDHVAIDSVDAEAQTQTLTQAGQIVGTAAYMSPEQATGKPVDSRSDIFSLGCVLYEMLAGKRAFDGATPQQTILAITGQDPVQLSELRPDLPFALDRLIRRCLEKEPGERFESARDVAFALETLSDDRPPSRPMPRAETPEVRGYARAAIAVAAVIMIGLVGWYLADRWFWGGSEMPGSVHLAVLEFEPEGADLDLQETAVGLRHVLEEGLSVIEQDSRGAFWVIPTDDAERFGAETIEDFGRVFEANVALVGRLEQRGDLLHLGLEIIDTGSGRTLGRVSIEDSVSNVSSFQEGLVLDVAERLGISVSEETREYLISMTTTMPEGFSAYVRGIGVAALAKNEVDFDRAMDLLATSTSLDPLFLTGRVARGRVSLERYHHTGQEEWFELAREDAQATTTGGLNLEEANLLLADLERVRGRMPEAISALETAIWIAPSSAESRMALADAYKAANRFRDSEREARRAVFLRPGYWPTHDFLAKLYVASGDYVAAAIEFGEVISCAPRLTKGYNNLGGVLVFLKRTEEAKRLFEQSIAIAPSRPAFSNLGVIYFDEKRFADAATMFELAIEQDDDRYRTWGNLGYAYRFGPAPEKADECFQMAVDLAGKVLEEDPEDLWTKTELAGYHAMLGRPDRGLPLLEEVVGRHTVEPELVAKIAETFEDLGDRERALSWVARSFAIGITPARFETCPTLRELIADKRYQQLVLEAFEHS